MDAAQSLEKVLEHEALIRDSYSKASSSGLLAALNLIDVKGLDRQSFETRLFILKELSEEQLYYDLLLSRELIGTPFDELTKEDIQRFIVCTIDYAIQKNLSTKNLSSLDQLSQTIQGLDQSKKQHLLAKAFLGRLGIAFYYGIAVDRVFLQRKIQEKIQGLAEFPINFFSLFKLKRLIEKLLLIDQSIEGISGPLTQIESQHREIMRHIRNTAINIGNHNAKSNFNQVLGPIKYLHGLLGLFPRMPPEISDSLEHDVKILNSGNARNIKINALLLLVCAIFTGKNVLDNLNTWRIMANSDLGMNLIVKSVNNPALIKEIHPGDVIFRVGDKINPTPEEIRGIIDQSETTVSLGVISGSHQKSVSAPLMSSNEKAVVGITFYGISLEQKMQTILVLLVFVFYTLNISAYKIRMLGAIEPTLSYGLMSIFFAYMATSIPRLYPKIIGLEPLALLVLAALVGTGWWLHGNLGVPRAWLKFIFTRGGRLG